VSRATPGLGCSVRCVGTNKAGSRCILLDRDEPYFEATCRKETRVTDERDDERQNPEEPESERLDQESEQRELEAAGWVRMEREGKIVWRNPESGHLYPQGAAVAFVRRSTDSG
jgi:hypothetical protein